MWEEFRRRSSCAADKGRHPRPNAAQSESAALARNADSSPLTVRRAGRPLATATRLTGRYLLPHNPVPRLAQRLIILAPLHMHCALPPLARLTLFLLSVYCYTLIADHTANLHKRQSSKLSVWLRLSPVPHPLQNPEDPSRSTGTRHFDARLILRPQRLSPPECWPLCKYPITLMSNPQSRLHGRLYEHR